ncbi:amino acid/amide ABC transporter substrate-binding protein, HAAT family [Halopelagius longus]|uniref:Amino acid/amide ABC transporter substrate-binding protein, HAAT family n=2 Tax=Halopelagius longus TaxID=1236180 RepID=A0A1H1DM72_9EURY|nr:amino acid/amide ABC transporter substrate-binding protein, HAAT family [Halopelagius longus]
MKSDISTRSDGTTSRRRFLAAGVGTLGLGTFGGCLSSVRGDGRDPVKFGMVAPLSGSLERIGTHCKRAVEQAVADVNDAGGVLDRPVELVVVDSGASAETAVSEYESMRGEGVVGFVGGLVSDVSIALAPKAAEDGLMEVSPASTSPSLTGAGVNGDRTFFGRTIPSDLLQSVVMAKALDDPRYVDADRVSLVYIDNAYGSGLAEALHENLSASVAADVAYDPSADDFAPVVEEAFADDPDAVGFVSASGQEKGVLDAYDASDYEAPWVFSTGMLSGDLPSYYEGFYSASLSSVRTNGYLTLTKKLSELDPIAPYAVNGYDALMLMAAAAEHAGEAAGPAIADSIRAVSGGTGHTFSVGEFDRARALLDAGRDVNYQGAASGVDLNADLEPLSPYVVERVTDGGVEQLELIQKGYFGGDGQ